MTENSARDVHQEGEKARENRQFSTAEAFYLRAKAMYFANSDWVGVSEIYASESILYRLESRESANPEFQAAKMLEAKMAAETSVQFATFAMERGNGSGLALALFNRAKIEDDALNFRKAIETYEKAIEWFSKAPPEEHNRSAVRTDFELKLELAKVSNGDVAALKTVEQKITVLLADDGVDRAYNIPAWVSGAYLKLAKLAMISKDVSFRVRREEFLDKAKEIIDSQPALLIRRREYEELASRLDELP